MEPYHIPVLLQESVDGLNVRPDGVYADLTFGGGGHSREILRRLGPKGRLIAFDQDADAMANLPQDDRLIFAHNNFRYMRGVVRSLGFERVDGILADLGVSAHHFDASQRGFSFRFDAELDMRMNRKAAFSAKDVVNGYEHARLLEVLRDYGELQQPHKLAAAIEAARPLLTTGDLKRAVARYVPSKEETKFFAKLFQAVRIEVNGELEALRMMLEQSVKLLTEGGRISVITYHSLEDRAVKNFFRSGTFDGKVEKDFYGNKLSPFVPVGKGVIVPSEAEVAANPKARSAKLRVAQREVR